MRQHQHRFRGSLTERCREAFGGVAPCGLPYDHLRHFSDSRHPYRYPYGSFKGCSWEMQGKAPVFSFCGLLQTSAVHQLTEWGSGLVRPPDEDAEARSGVVAPWQTVVEALTVRKASVLGGPWSARQFRLGDAADGADDEERFGECLGALLTTGGDWSCVVERDLGVRWALVTWGHYCGLARGVLADEIASEYDEG